MKGYIKSKFKRNIKAEYQNDNDFSSIVMKEYIKSKFKKNIKTKNINDNAFFSTDTKSDLLDFLDYILSKTNETNETIYFEVSSDLFDSSKLETIKRNLNSDFDIVTALSDDSSKYSVHLSDLNYNMCDILINMAFSDLDGESRYFISAYLKKLKSKKEPFKLINEEINRLVQTDDENIELNLNDDSLKFHPLKISKEKVKLIDNIKLVDLNRIFNNLGNDILSMKNNLILLSYNKENCNELEFIKIIRRLLIIKNVDIADKLRTLKVNEVVVISDFSLNFDLEDVTMYPLRGRGIQIIKYLLLQDIKSETFDDEQSAIIAMLDFQIHLNRSNNVRFDKLFNCIPLGKHGCLLYDNDEHII